MRERPTVLEQTLLKLEERVDRFGDLAQWGDLPSELQNEDVRRGLRRAQLLAANELPAAGAAEVAPMLTAVAAEWERAAEATHHSTWEGAADAVDRILNEIAAEVGRVTGRPSVLETTSEDVEMILLRAIRREKRRPGEFHLHELVRKHVPGAPSDAFFYAGQAVSDVLIRKGLGEEDEPATEDRIAVLWSAVELARSGALRLEI